MQKYKLETSAGEIRITVNDGSGRMHSEIPRDREDDEYDAMLDGIEALILAHACAGINVEEDSYVEGVESALQGIANN